MSEEWTASEVARVEGGAYAGPPAMRPAGFWIRAAALVLDSVFLFFVALALDAVTRLIWGDLATRSTVIQASGMAFQILFPLFYFVLFHWRAGQTLGKMMVDIRVVLVDGGRLTLGVAVLRYFAAMLSAVVFGIGYVMAGLRADKRALHDLLAGTRVERLAAPHAAGGVHQAAVG
jgi:uncharacterized RDD family membrane protein YckC